MLLRITAPHFCAGIDYPKKYAPIVRWLKGKSLLDIKAICHQRSWKLELLGENRGGTCFKTTKNRG